MALILGLAAAGVAFWFLITGRSERPMADIDDASRHRLEQVLEESEQPGG
jgi:hypothetical protein